MDNTQQLPTDLDLEIIWDEHSALIGDDIDDLSYWSGREVMKKEDFVKAISPIAYKLHFAQQENAQLKRWKMEAAELLTPIHAYVHKNMEVSLGQCNVKLVLDRCKQYDTAVTLLEKFISRHEAGLLPDRFIYDEIKQFLDGTK